MNTYQMHTLSFLSFYHIFSSPLSLLSLCFFDFSRPSFQLIPSLFSLILCHTDVTCSVVLHNVTLCMGMCVFIPLSSLCICMWYVSEYCVCLLCEEPVCVSFFYYVISYYVFNTCALWITVHKLAHESVGYEHLMLTVSQASVARSSFAGYSGVGLVHWLERGQTRLHSDCHEWHGPNLAVTNHLGLWERDEGGTGDEKRAEMVEKRSRVKQNTLISSLHY